MPARTSAGARKSVSAARLLRDFAVTGFVEIMTSQKQEAGYCSSVLEAGEAGGTRQNFFAHTHVIVVADHGRRARSII
jgi:hypothetical protein